ncbi:cytochrome P450 [Pseudonocardia alni]|uniref:cytochrome P450 n=1 Tax=Pseudonocardia alni TaxID=33907 RepID=UPI00280BB903|nr:cytochrome P450 [Pseudonocardia alni]
MTTTTSGACPFSSAGAEFNPFVEPYLADPYEFLARAREEEPVFYSPEIDYWVVTRYADIQSVFRDTKTFSATIALEPLTPLYPSSIEKVIEVGYVPGPVLVNEDEPLHRTRRKRIGDAFAPKRVRELEPRIREIVTQYLDKFVKDGRADLVDDFVWEIPALVIFMFMGVPDDEAGLVKQFAARRTLFTWGRPTEAEQNQLVEEVGTYWNYCKSHVARLSENLGDDFMSDVIRAHREDPELIDETYLYNTMLNFLFAGHETTTNASGNGFRTLLENREAWEEICRDPSLIPNAVEEILRFSSSVIAWRRRAVAEATIGGVEIPEGANVLIVNGSGNHDSSMFPEGDSFDIHRPNADRHLAFGFGSRTCMGSPLARLEMKVILEELTRRLPHMRLVGGQKFTYSPNTSFRGPDHVLVEWDPASNPVPDDRP